MNMNLQALAVLVKNNRYSEPQARDIIKLDGKEAFATDNFILAVCPLETDKPGMVGVAEIKEAKKLDNINIDERTITPSKRQNGSKDLIRIQELEVRSYPPVEKVRKSQGQNTYLRVGLGLGVLENLVKMMKKADRGVIELEFSDFHGSSIFGKVGDIELTIMPVHI